MAELTLAAALRDVHASRPEARNLAVRSLAPALLDELGMVAPVWWDRIDHPRRDDVVDALEQACDDAAPQNAALARIGLAEIGAPSAHARATQALDSDLDDDAGMFLRECGVICLSLIGAAARDFLAEPGASGPDARGRAEALLAAIVPELSTLLREGPDDVRFQAGPALVEVCGPASEAELLAAFEAETHEQVRANLIAAISMLDPPSAAASAVLAAVLDSAEGKGEVGWEAAMALAAARRPEAAPRLLEGLRRQTTRDRALEALAVLGAAAPPDTAASVRRYTRSLWIPVFTRVRAAYALARIEPAAGEALLARLAKHPRSAVREAVAEARANLAKLAALDDEAEPSSHHAYRRG